MRRVLSAILFVLLLFQALYSLTVVTYFYANRPYIASVLCENRDKPETGCKGKCYLNKQLNKAQNNNPQDVEMRQKVEIMPYISVNSPEVAPITYYSVLFFGEHIPSFYSFLLQTEFFHPPQVA